MVGIKDTKFILIRLTMWAARERVHVRLLTRTYSNYPSVLLLILCFFFSIRLLCFDWIFSFHAQVPVTLFPLAGGMWKNDYLCYSWSIYSWRIFDIFFPHFDVIRDFMTMITIYQFDLLWINRSDAVGNAFQFPERDWKSNLIVKFMCFKGNLAPCSWQQMPTCDD